MNSLKKAVEKKKTGRILKRAKIKSNRLIQVGLICLGKTVTLKMLLYTLILAIFSLCVERKK